MQERTGQGGVKPPLLLGRGCRLVLDRPQIMGILNLTPDSFYDGGADSSRSGVLTRVAQMVADGADIIDVGGESTRPGAAQVSEAEELDRVVPAIEAISAGFDIPVSIDTTKSGVARAAVDAGAAFINDISGLQFDAQMAAVAADSGAGLFLMHTRGRPEVMQDDTEYADVVDEVTRFLRRAIGLAVSAGVERERIAIDPGIGFGKDLAGNLELLRRLPELKQLGRPILLGTSRKSFIGRILQQDDPSQRLAGTLATLALAVAAGVEIFRVHDVREARETVDVAAAISGFHCSG